MQSVPITDHWCWEFESRPKRGVQHNVIKVCQWLETGRWFSSGPPISSTTKTDRHDITEILWKVALNTIKPNHINCYKVVDIIDITSFILSIKINWFQNVNRMIHMEFMSCTILIHRKATPLRWVQPPKVCPEVEQGEINIQITLMTGRRWVSCIHWKQRSQPVKDYLQQIL